MKIIELKISINSQEEKKFDLSNKWTLITSSGKNSQGKSTIIRALLYGLGFILKDNFVNGTKIEKLTTRIKFSNGFKFIRNKKNIKFTNNDFFKVLPLFEKEHLKKWINECELIFKSNWEFISSFLFANYSDQQYGLDVINKGRTGPFPKDFNFSIAKLTESISSDYKAKKLLEQEKKKLSKYESDLEFVKRNTDIEDSKVKMDLKDIDATIKIKNLKSKIILLKTLEKKHRSRISLISAFENNIPQLNLFYRDNKNVDHSLTIDNFRENINIQKNVISIRIDEINQQIKELENQELELNKHILKIGGVQGISNLVERIKKNRIKILESDYETFQNKKRAIKDQIEKIQKKLSLKQLDQIAIHMNKFLAKFAKINKDIEIWIDKFKEEQYEILLNKSSKFITYVGAIRFIIATSFKFAISNYLWIKGIKLPIIIDQPFPKGLEIEIKRVYLKILNELPHNKIIAAIDEKFIKILDPSPKYEKIVVSKNTFATNQLVLFSTLE